MSATESNVIQTRTTVLPNEKRCRHTLADGQRCGGRRVNGSELCLWHDPERARQQAQRRAERKAGKQKEEVNGAELLALSEKQYLDAGELRAVLARTLARLEQGTMNPGVAYATGYVVQLLVTLPAPPRLRKRLEDMTPKELEARNRAIRREVRRIYGWTDEELEDV